MNLILSNELNEIISYSREEAMRMGSYTISVDHLILGIIRHQDNAAFEIIMNFGIDFKDLKVKIEGQLKIGQMVPYDQADKINLSTPDFFNFSTSFGNNNNSPVPSNPANP